jgi:hypothetical protein
MKTLQNLLVLVFALTNVIQAQIPDNPHKAPLYWSVYEFHRIREFNGEESNYIPEEVFMRNIQMVNTQLKPAGYNMVCIDGWGDVDSYNEYGYRTKHSSQWEHDFAWWADTLQKLDMNLGMYHNPLWISKPAADAGALIEGTSYPLSNLIDETEDALWFKWCQVDQPGAKEYIKGNIQFYADMGIKYLRVDFLSWFEDGYDKNFGTVGPERTLAEYDSALAWMAEACNENDMLLSLVMPHLKNEGATELKYGHMIRINEDVLEGRWYRLSEDQRGIRRDYWSQYTNPFDGYTYWSYLAGREKMILDGDFIRLDTYENIHEKQSAISLHLMAGGPLSPTDQAGSTMTDENIAIYTNEEMLALNEDGFVGMPLTNDPTIDSSQIWKGQLQNGDWVLAFFNRSGDLITRSYDFNKLGISGNAKVRDLWNKIDIGTHTSIEASIPAHGCAVYKIVEGSGSLTNQEITFPQQTDIADISSVPFVKLNALSNSGLTISYEVTDGPATISNDTVFFTGGSGNVIVYAHQDGDDTYAAAMPVPIEFHVTDPVMPYNGIYILGNATPSDWNIGNPFAFKQNLENPYLFEWHGVLKEGEIKFSTFKGDWCDGDWLNATQADQSITATDYQITIACDGPDYKWKVEASEAGEYIIKIDIENGTILFDDPYPADSLYLVGDATPSGWDIANPVAMERSSTNPYQFTWQGELAEGEIKFSTFKGDWCDGLWINAETNNQTIDNYEFVYTNACDGPDNKWLVDSIEAGLYSIFVDLQYNYIKFNKIDLYTAIHIVGDASPSGWNIASPEAFTQDSEDETVFTWTGNLTQGELKFSTFTGDWCDGDWLLAPEANHNLTTDLYTTYTGCPPGEEDLKWLVGETDAGSYIITINVLTKEVSFEPFVNVQTTNSNHGVFISYSDARKIVSIQVERIENAMVEFYSITGNKIYEKQLSNGENHISCENFGREKLLIVKVSSDSFTKTQKLLFK